MDASADYRPAWNTEAADSTGSITMEQNLKMRTDASNVCMQTDALRRTMELNRRRNPKYVEFIMGQLVYVWLPQGKKDRHVNQIGTEIGIGSVHNDGSLGRFVRCDNTSLYRATFAHIRSATTR